MYSGGNHLLPLSDWRSRERKGTGNFWKPFPIRRGASQVFEQLGGSVLSGILTSGDWTGTSRERIKKDPPFRNWKRGRRKESIRQGDGKEKPTIWDKLGFYVPSRILISIGSPCFSFTSFYPKREEPEDSWVGNENPTRQVGNRVATWILPALIFDAWILEILECS